MDKKIAFFTEMKLVGKIPREYRNMKTLEAWICSLNAEHFYLGAINNSFRGKEFDLGIIIIPKNWFKSDVNTILETLNVIDIIKSNCKKIAIMQEGPHTYFQDFSVQHQFIYLAVLHKADFLLCHNEYDINYFKGLTGKNTYPLQSLMIEDSIKEFKKVETGGVMIGGNFVSWYGGFDSYIVAQEFGVEMFAPSMGRKQIQENHIPDITYLEYMDWPNWMVELSKNKYAVHLMRTYAAGTFALNCAYWGIPCIGYENIDTQRILHEHTTVKEGDILSARKIANDLKDEEFYQICSENVHHAYLYTYTEESFLEKFNKILEAEKI